MSRGKIRFIVLFVTVVAVAFFIFRDRSPFGKNNSSFAVSPEKDITDIEMVQGDKRLLLEKHGEKWIVNDSAEARKSAVTFIIRTLKEMRIKSPVSPEIFKNEVLAKELTPVKVKVYENRRVLKSFIVYKTASNPYGNIMKMRNSSKPFIVYIPGYEDNIGTHFTLNELFWQPYSVFYYLPSEIESAELEDFIVPENSFLINNRKNNFSLVSKNIEFKGWDTLKVRRYLSYFTSLPFESWAFDLSEAERKEIITSSPLYRITLTIRNEKKISLIIWEKWRLENGNRVKDTDRVWGKMEGKGDNIFIMRYFDIDPILKKKSYFSKD